MIFMFVLSEYIKERSRVGERIEKGKGGRCINSRERWRERETKRLCLVKFV